MFENILKLLCLQLTLTFIIVKISYKLSLIDFPSQRKIHQKPTPYTGGIILGLTYLFMVFITNFDDKFINLLLSFSIIICLTGLIDDRYNINPGTKLLFQAFSIFFLIDNNFYLKDLGEYYFLGKITLGSFDKVFTILSILLLINSFNYSDGIDGLLTSLTLVILITFVIYIFILNSDLNIYLIFLCLPLFIFLIFNLGIVKGFKIFLGDSGSNLLGYLTAFLSIYLYNYHKIHPALIMWPLAYVIYEFLTVNLIRLTNNSGVFKAGHDHLHYELKKIFKISNFKILGIIILLNVFFSFVGYKIYQIFSQDFSILAFVTLFIIYFYLRTKIRKKTIQ